MTARQHPIDQPIREQIRTDLDENLCVEAGAGTGKTTSLVAESSSCSRAATADRGQPRRDHLHRGGGGRALGSCSRRTRAARLPTESDPDRAAIASSTRCDRSTARGSRRSTRSARACCTSGRSRPASTPSSGAQPTSRPILFDEAYDAWLDELLTRRASGGRARLQPRARPGDVPGRRRDRHRFRYLLPLGAPTPSARRSSAEVVRLARASMRELDGIADADAMTTTDRGLGHASGSRFGRRLEIEGSTERGAGAGDRAPRCRTCN